MRLYSAQQQFSVNVWTGIIGDYLVGTYLLSFQLDVWKYRIFLEEVLWELLDVVHVSVRRAMCFQINGAPAHFFRAIRDYLNRTFAPRWIGRNAPVP